MARALPRLRRVEHDGRRRRAAAPAAADGAGSGAGGRRRALTPGAAADVEAPAGGAPAHGHRRARPRAGRRAGARVARAARRVAGHRQVHAHRRRARQPGRGGAARCCTCRGEESAAQVQAARRAARRRARSACRSWPRPTSTRCWPRSRPSGPTCAWSTRCRCSTTPALTGAPGSVGQVREVAGRLMRVAKERGIADAARGPRDQGGRAGRAARARAPGGLRAAASRASASAPTAPCARSRTASARPTRPACSRCASEGLVEVAGRLARASWREATRAPGSVVLCAMEGSRPLLVEVQALVAPSELVPPRRVANGVDRNRLALVLAVLARHGGVALGSSDVFVSVAGGVRVDEPGADLAIALALASRREGRRARPGRRRWPPSASSGSPASCATWRTPTGGWPRRRSSACRRSSRPGDADRRRCVTRCASRAGWKGRLPQPNPLHRAKNDAISSAFPVEWVFMPYAGDDVAELEARQEPRLVRALEMVAPGTAVREGLDNIVQGRTGALICIGESEELSFLLSGGVKLDVDYTPALLYPARQDGRRDHASPRTARRSSGPTCS